MSALNSPTKIASLISGGGTTMCEIQRACLRGDVDAQLTCVISSNPNAEGIQRAKAVGIPDRDIIVVNPNNFREGPDNKINQEAFGEALLRELTKRDIQYVLQNGWLPLTPISVINQFTGRIFNQHPGPVPECGGAGMFGRRVHAAILLFRRLTRSSEGTEIIAQQVAPQFDDGAVLERLVVPILPEDTVESLQARTLPLEHSLQIQLLSKLISNTSSPVPSRDSWVTTSEHATHLETARKMAKLLYPKG